MQAVISINHICVRECIVTYRPYQNYSSIDWIRLFHYINKYLHDNIFNADETCFRTFPFSLAKVYGYTNTGKDGRKVNVNVDVKQGITCMATISVAGTSLKSFFIKKGKTQRCLAPIKILNIDCTYSANGWMTEDTSIEYINTIIIPHLKGAAGCLIWDIYAAHTTEKVKQHCAANNIELIYVPASMTHKRQPLDTHIFGVIKQQYKKIYYQRVFSKLQDIQQINAIQKCDGLLTMLDKSLIVKSFRQSILDDARSTRLAADDPRPIIIKQTKTKNVVSSCSSKNEVVDDSDDEDDELKPSHHQFEDDEYEDDSESDDDTVVPATMHTHRHSRTAHSVSHNASIARTLQYSFG